MQNGQRPTLGKDTVPSQWLGVNTARGMFMDLLTAVGISSY